MTTAESCWDLALALAVHHPRVGRELAQQRSEGIFQVSTMSALVAGIYDGDTSYAQIMGHGDFGVGTFNALDGEMVALDGSYFHLHSDGGVTDVDPSDLTPFAAVTFFRADAEMEITSPHTRQRLLGLVDATVPSVSSFYAIRIDGTFTSVTTRTAVRQHKPYPGLAEATQSQVEHTVSAVSGTIVGFRAPQYAQTTTVAGYHLHFIDDTRAVGGHVLDFALAAGTVSIDQDADLHVEVSASAGVFGAGMTDAEIADDIARAENARAIGGKR